jgi:hypothetical protein
MECKEQELKTIANHETMSVSVSSGSFQQRYQGIPK